MAVAVRSANSPFAKPHPGRQFSVQGDAGSSNSRAVFTSHDALNLSDGDFSAWFSVHFDQVIREEGAVLLMDGRGADLASFRHRVRRALEQLRVHFSAASVQSVICETQLEGEFSGVYWPDQPI